MEEVAREGLGSKGCDGRGQAVPQRRPPGRVVSCLLASGGDVGAELVPVGDAAANGSGGTGHVELRGADDGMSDRTCERSIHGRGIGGGGGGQTVAVWRQAVGPGEMERAAVAAGVLVQEAKLGGDGWRMGDGGPFLEWGVERTLGECAHDGMRVAEGAGDVMMQPEWRMIMVEFPVGGRRCVAAVGGILDGPWDTG